MVDKWFHLLLKKPFSHVLIIVTLILVCYSNTFQAPFEFDGLNEIVDNITVHGLSNFFDSGSHPNRYVGFFTFALNYQFNGLNVTGYHVVFIGVGVESGNIGFDGQN